MEKHCQGCETIFETEKVEKVYCSRRCGRAYRERKRKKRVQQRIDIDPVFAEAFRTKAKKRSKKYYQVHAEQERARGRARYVSRQTFCEECGAKTLKGNNVCWKCRSKRVPVSVVCKDCGSVFVGDRRSKYCPQCKTNSETLRIGVRCYLQRIRAKLAGLPANMKPKDWRFAKLYFGNRCAYCGRDGDLHQDHFIPHVLGGGYTKDNIVPACPTCNGIKGDQHPAMWLPVEKYQQINAYLKGIS